VAGGEKRRGRRLASARGPMVTEMWMWPVPGVYWDGVSSAMLLVSFRLSAWSRIGFPWHTPLNCYAHSQNCTGYHLRFPWGYFGEPPIVLLPYLLVFSSVFLVTEHVLKFCYLHSECLKLQEIHPVLPISRSTKGCLILSTKTPSLL
jgi:hypothetical protein